MNFVLHPSFKLLFSILCFGLILTACSTTYIPTSHKAPASHVVTVDLQEGDTETSIQEQYGGDILVWGDDFAVLSLHSDDALHLQSELTSTFWGRARVERNKATFFATGEVGMNGSGLWANGSGLWANGSGLWAGGSGLWASGDDVWADSEFIMMPQNTSSWLQIGLDQAHDLAPHLGYGVKVAIIDSGLDLSHPAFVNSLAPQNEWLDLVDDDNYPQEEGFLGEGAYGHGTAVAGIVRQVAPSATILPIRVLDETGAGYLEDLIEAVNWARKKGADVINMSLGSPDYSYAVDQVIGDAALNGHLMVSSAGNMSSYHIVFPAMQASDWSTGFNRLSVTSVDRNDIRSSFASIGWSVELAAPGEYIYGPAPDMRMASWSGTSMAAPVASGAIALALAEQLKVDRDKVLQQLENTAENIYHISSNGNFRNALGKGRIDIENFLTQTIR